MSLIPDSLSKNVTMDDLQGMAEEVIKWVIIASNEVVLPAMAPYMTHIEDLNDEMADCCLLSLQEVQQGP